MDEAYRLTFEFDGERFALISVRRLTMRVPPSQRTEAGDEVGRFVELRGEKGEVLYRRQITDLIERTLEYPTGDPERPFGRVEARGRKTIVSVLVPVRKGARSVVLVEAIGPRPDERGLRKAEGARELVSVDLPDERDER